MDNLARHHRLHGRPAVSLVLPMVLDVGTVAENEGIESSLRHKGMYGIDESDMLRGFELAMCSSHRSGVGVHDIGDSQIILGLEPSELARAMDANETVDAYWYCDARLKHVRSSVEAIGHAISATGNPRPGGGALDLLKDGSVASKDEVISLVAQHVADRVSSILLIPTERIDLDGPSIASYGLDSMVGAELRNWLFKEFRLNYSFQELLSPSLTFCGLAKIISSHLGIMTDTVN